MVLVELDEKRLIAEAANGDVSAFEHLYRMHVGRVYGLCIRLVDSQTEAEDCTQETFIKAWQRLGQFRGGSVLATWLHRIAFNEVMGRKRRYASEARHLSIVGASERVTAVESTTVDELEQAITRLPDRARQVFVLKRIYGYTHEETAQMLNIAVGTCKAQLYRASKLLATALSKQSAIPASASDDASDQHQISSE